MQSVHDHPRKWMRRLNKWSMGLALIIWLGALLAQLLFTLIISPLFLGTAIFTLILGIPLLLQTVLHPEVSVVESGVRLRPLLWREQAVRWEMISGLAEHPLLYQDPVMERKLHGRNARLREGCIILLNSSAPVLPLYRLVGGIAGYGLRPAFAISSTTHRDYHRLRELVLARSGVPPIAAAGSGS